MRREIVAMSDALDKLVDLERQAFMAWPVGVQLARAYCAAGGDLARLREIVQRAVDEQLNEELAKSDLPGPDSIIAPKIRAAVYEFVGRAFDKFAAGRP
jgi:hypothetical protein